MNNLNLNEKENIRYSWMINRIQNFKSLVLTTVLGLLAYAGISIDAVTNYISMILLIFASIFLLIALYLSAQDSGGALFYNEASQEELSKRSRSFLYICVFLGAFLILFAKTYNTFERITINAQKNHTSIIKE